jgi:hypothetical protein
MISKRIKWQVFPTIKKLPLNYLSIKRLGTNITAYSHISVAISEKTATLASYIEHVQYMTRPNPSGKG